MSTLDDLAPESRLGQSLNRIGLPARVLDRATSYSVRRGAIRDTAYVKEAVTGVETGCTSLVGRHSKNVKGIDLTLEYVGPLQIIVSIYEPRPSLRTIWAPSLQIHIWPCGLILPQKGRVS